MLKHRLLFGTLMTVFFTAVVIFDSWLDGSITYRTGDDYSIKGTIFCILIAVLLIPAQYEFSTFAKIKNFKYFTLFSIIASFLFASTSYWQQIIAIPQDIYIFFLCVLTVLGLFLYQYLTCATTNVLVNCGINCFGIFYLGLLSSAVMAIRVKFGVWPLLMFVYVIKSADIGAYTTGSLFGKHKFSPNISPGKTWEGMCGAIALAVVVGIGFALICGIMSWPLAIVFGVCFAFIGQMGDLAESMLKRDSQQKDSSNNVPGFGGILDVIDSPLVAAPFAYLFFMLSKNQG